MIFLVIPGIRRKWNFCTKKRCLSQGACREMNACHYVVSLREVNADGQEQMQLYTGTTEQVQQ